MKEPPDNSSPKIKDLLNPSFITLLTMVVLVGMGEKMAERFLPLYLLALGGGTFSIGLLSGMDNQLSAWYSFFGGYLSHKIGYKKALVLFNSMAIVGYSIVLLIPTWWAVVVGAIFFISWTAISLPAVMSMISKISKTNQRTMGVTFHSFVRRFPMALGPIIGGVLIQAYGIAKGIQISFTIAIILAAIAIILEWKIIDDVPKSMKKWIKLRDLNKLFNPSLRNLLIADILIRFAEQIPYAFAVVWAVSLHGITPAQFGILTAIEMITATLIYIPVANLADRYTKKPFISITFGFFTLFPFVLLFSKTFGMLVVAFIIRGLKEFGEPTRKALIMDLAPDNAKAITFGTYYLIRDQIVTIAAIGGAFLWGLDPINGPTINFVVAGTFGIIGTLYFLFFGKDLKRVPL
ncbi:MAG: MFS transporter [Promethearchaeota archaeon]